MTIDQLPPNTLIISFHFCCCLAVCVSAIISAKLYCLLLASVNVDRVHLAAIDWETVVHLGSRARRSVGCRTSVSDTVSLLIQES